MMLEGRVAIVTGGSSGIGEATALTLARAGAKVAVAARREEQLNAIVSQLESEGHEALAHCTDVTELSQVEQLAEATRERFGRIDILVNNAGTMPTSPMTEGRIADWKKMVDVNVNGVLHGVGAVLPTMLKQGTGHIVMIGSIAGRRPFRGGTVYAATKFAVRALSWGLHLELGAEHGIRVTDIQPGQVATELYDAVPEGSFKDAWDQAWEGKRRLNPQDIADTVLFAVSSPGHVAVSEVLIRPLDQPG